MKQYRYQYFQKKKFQCPACGHKNRFVRMIDTETGDFLPHNVGRCDRENKCGYEYHATKWAEDNKILGQEYRPIIHTPPVQVNRPIYYVAAEIFERSLTHYKDNYFVQYLVEVFGEQRAMAAVSQYFIGTSKRWPGATVFWLIDCSGKVRTGKIMLYDRATGKRVKNQDGRGFIDWAHRHTGDPDPNMVQCFFGEHLLSKRPNAPVGIVESQKTAVIASLYLPEYVWLATGGSTGCKWTTPDIAGALKDRDVILFPDSGYAGKIKGRSPDEKTTAFEHWQHKAPELKKAGHWRSVSISKILEQIPREEWANGLDIADYLLKYHVSEFEKPVTDKRATTPITSPRPVSELHTDYNRYWQERSKRKADNIKMENWGPEIEEVQKFFTEAQELPGSFPIKLDAASVIKTPSDLSSFVNTHLLVVRQNNGIPSFRPYLNRLFKIKQLIESIKI